MSHKKRFILLTILALLIVGLVGFHPAKAYAYQAVTWTDNFNTPSNWTCDIPFQDTGCGVTTSWVSRSQPYFGYIYARNLNSSHWAGIGRTITLTPPPGYPTLSSCRAGIWVENASSIPGSPPTPIVGSGQLEIINSSNWTYITKAPFTLSAQSTESGVGTYQGIQTGYFYPAAGSNIYLRLVVDAGTVSNGTTEFWADDMTVSCQFLG